MVFCAEGYAAYGVEVDAVYAELGFGVAGIMHLGSCLEFLAAQGWFMVYGAEGCVVYASSVVEV
jgi:hypothetical protein